MSKDVIIAGTIAVGCIALIAVAFIAPKSKSSTEAETPKPETTTTLTDPGLTGGMSTSGLSTGGAATSGFDPMNPNGGINALPPIGSTTGGSTAGSSTAGGTTGAFSGLPPASPTGFGTTGGLNNPNSNFDTQLHGPTPVVPPAEPIAPVASESKTHTVANGELLGDIALKYYKSSKQWRKIAEANPGIDPKNLKVGQKLVIPGIEAKSAETPVVAGAGERTYTIKSGDTLYLVAKKELGSASRWKEIEKLNGVSSSELHVGQVIKLPASASASTPAVTPSTDPSAAPTAGSKTHTVSKGETLGDISKHYYGTSKNWKKIVDANAGTSPENLKVGQKLVIPEVAGSTTSANGGAVENAAPTTNEYVIKAGDTLGTIAQKELGSKNRWKELQEANPGLDPRNLRAGQKIKIPGKKSEAAPAAPEKVNPPAASPFGTPGLGAPSAPGAKLPATNTPGAPAAPAFGTPTAQPPSNFPADPTFASPYNGSNFGEPAQPFAQTGQGFNQTGTSPATPPAPFPGQPNAFGAPGAPAAPGEAALR